MRLKQVIFTLATACFIWSCQARTTLYKQGDSIPIYYNKIFSLQNQLSYSYQSLPFICPIQQTSRRKRSLLVFDQDFRGDRLAQSDYKVKKLKLLFVAMETRKTKTRRHILF